MLNAAGRLRRVFQLPVPDAPGLVFFGGEADPAALDSRLAGLPLGNLAGSGLTTDQAFESCVGEGIEYLSQFLRADDPIVTAPSGETADGKDAEARQFIAGVFDARNRPTAWIATRRMADGMEAWFPIELCLRTAKRDVSPPFKLSTGCAAGATLADATLRAMLELIERDALALWWRGGRRGRPIAANSATARTAAALLAQLRQGCDRRDTWLLDITTDIGIPVVVAVSADADGYGCACGFASRLTRVEAARAAIFEMCQVELGQHVVAVKRHSDGDAALSDDERRILRRGTELDARRCALMQPAGADAPETAAAPSEAEVALQHVVDRFDRLGIMAYLLDLTRVEFGIPVARVLAPHLQLEPCAIIGERLARAIRETGGGAVHTSGLPLL